MDKLKKAAAVAVMVGGMALGGGVAHADGGHDFYKDSRDAGDVIIGNLQNVQCKQEVGDITALPVAVPAVEGESTTVIGNNFCTVIGSIED
ncbi:hypothetical protein ACIP4U_01600 [Streptomyces caelestis]|jgi:hypothetical protein|uniref:Chaplin domain-containing protein n=1 Tax=Streptomyces caelestis TaxID=36816 RepID=A0A7W9H3E2_9ACTN|nr:hypothetical protein [Streptomyces caelestis]MBB5794865.1 hypothetical protein [Streptomyces caelestis]GGW27673.1 hypothetical protein GCM10010320_03010 [Streptomyces caelestis]